jgi:hypothetical protein
MIQSQSQDANPGSQSGTEDGGPSTQQGAAMSVQSLLNEGCEQEYFSLQEHTWNGTRNEQDD